MFSRFALTVFVIIGLAVSVFTIIEQDGDELYELPASSMNISDARNNICEDFGHLQDLVTRNPPDQTNKYQLKVTLTRPPGYSQYLGRVRVGARIYSLVFATAAFDMWVDPSIPPQNKGSGHQLSPIGNESNKAPVSENLFGGTVKGWRYRNTVEIDRLAIPGIPFASARRKMGFGEDVGHGAVPFPFQEYRVLKHHSFWMRAQTKLERNVVAFSHRLTLGEVHIGMIENVYVGNIEYHPCAASFFWMTKKAKIRVNLESLGLEDETIIFDTASRYIRGPADAVQKIYESIPGSQTLEDGLYGYPCDITPPKITIQLGMGREWAIEPYLFNRWGTRPNPSHPFHPDHPRHRAYAQPPKNPLHPELCIGLFAAHTEYTVKIPQSRLSKPVLTHEFWVMGHPFLVGKYLVLDRDSRQIGVAELPPISSYLLPGAAPHGTNVV